MPDALTERWLPLIVYVSKGLGWDKNTQQYIFIEGNTFGTEIYWKHYAVTINKKAKIAQKGLLEFKVKTLPGDQVFGHTCYRFCQK